MSEWIPVIVQLIIALASIYAVASRLPKQRSEIKVDTANAADRLTAGYDRLLEEKDKQLATRDKALAEAIQQASLVPRQAEQIDRLERELSDAKALLAQQQDLHEVQTLIGELLKELRVRRRA